MEGIAPSSFGTHVASLAGVPASVVARAEAISKDFTAKFDQKQAIRRSHALPLMKQADFALLHKIANSANALNSLPDTVQHQTLQIIRRTLASPS